MAIEVEQKFRVADVAVLEARLAELGATVGEEQLQVDCYYAHPQRDFAKTDEALRLRRIGSHNYITYKGPKLDVATKTREEIELSLPPGESGASESARLLEALGFRPVAEVRKHRRHFELTWESRRLEVCFDQVDGLGDFVELEIVVEGEELAAAQAAVASLAQRLELSAGERRSYLELLLEGRSLGSP
jgi:adenylate cyclase class 2